SGLLGIFFFDADRAVHDANEAFLRMVGYRREELPGRWDEITPPEFRERDERALGELAQQGICVPFEKEYLRKDGTRVPVLVGGAFLDGQKRQGVAFVLDVS